MELKKFLAIDKSLKREQVWILDIQGNGDGEFAYDNELHVFSNQEACWKIFAEIYGERVLGFVNFNEILNDFFGDDEILYGVERREHFNSLIERAKEAYEKAAKNPEGYIESGYQFRVMERTILESSGRIFFSEGEAEKEISL